MPVHHQVDEAEGVPGEADEVGGGQVHKQEPHPALDPAVTRLHAGVLGKFIRIF